MLFADLFFSPVAHYFWLPIPLPYRDIPLPSLSDVNTIKPFALPSPHLLMLSISGISNVSHSITLRLRPFLFYD